MGAKLAAYASHAGVAPQTIEAAYEKHVARRLDFLGDVFHPELLHPARTVLVLLADTGVRDAFVLTAAALLESEHRELRLSLEEIDHAFGGRIAELVASVPTPAAAGEALLEELLMLPRDVALITVAERLDHARHLHFRDPSEWRAFHRQISETYLPFSGRVSEALSARLSRWEHAFRQKHLSEVLP